MSDRRAALYLQIPAAYCRSFGGLRWAQRGEAVEFLDGPDAGRTFAFAAEIGLFLEGLLVPGRPCLAFGPALHLLYLIGLGDRAGGSAPSRRLGRLARSFREHASPLRNAGALCGWLCDEIPGVPDPPALSGILELLNGEGWIPQMVLSNRLLGTQDYAEQPPLGPQEFEDRLTQRLEGVSSATIDHWLKFGCGPVGGRDERLAATPPTGVAASRLEVEERPRLAGIARLISRFEGALSLPPHRPDLTGLQTDGYWDLTTRGSPEQILPIQFALEDEEFLRRFAERELLYFHRETPSRPVAQDLVLILDQGVRTWGDVRLVLAGAAMAMARQGARRKLTVRLATTGNGGEAVDPGRLDAEALGALLEASDLSPNPARTLTRLLRDDTGSRRDVVLLTHPRSLADPEVAIAARLGHLETGSGTRLFAVTVSASGEVELAELRRGRPVVISRCRAELAEAAGIAPLATLRTPAGPRLAWRGAVEPIPFPFRCGLLGPVVESGDAGSRFIDFDESGGRILVMLRYGLIAAYRLDGTDAEVLPRPIVGGEVMKPIKSAIGVAGGFVLVGGIQDRPILAHYDFVNRTCTIHVLAMVDCPMSMFYYSDLHTIVARPAAMGRPTLAVDLANDAAGAWETWGREKEALERVHARNSPDPPPDVVHVMPRLSMAGVSLPAVQLDARTGTLEYCQDSGERRLLTPMSNGRPALQAINARIVSACQGGDVLAVQVAAGSAADVWFISMARAAVLGSMCSQPDEPDMRWFALSRDGSQFARRVGAGEVEVRDVPGDRPPVLVTPREHLWVHFASLGRSCLLVREFRQFGERRPHAHILIRWDGERLAVDHDDPVQVFQRLGGVVAESRGLPPGKMPPQCDHVRFVQIIEHHSLRILIDQYNHLAVLGQNGILVVLVYVAGEEFAAWMPDGTCLGANRLIGGQPSKAAAERIAASLRAAERGEGGGR